MSEANYKKTLYEKIWDAHLVREAKGEPTVLVHRLALDPRGYDSASVHRIARKRIASATA